MTLYGVAAAAVGLVWLAAVILIGLVRGGLLKRTWNEPYIRDLAVVIESDDWGPGPERDAARLEAIFGCLGSHRDAYGRPATLTADMVLAVPDFDAMRANGFREYARRRLDEGYEHILSTLRKGMESGVVVPQLHGLEHLNGEGLARLAAKGDTRVEPLAEGPAWDWESLASPLQGHYVDGTGLPATGLTEEAQQSLVETATREFTRLFGVPSHSTVAPCYLWDTATERAWEGENIRYVQTGGYRCIGRDEDGGYVQDPKVIRPGDRSACGQIYLARTIMYEPRDGRDAAEAKTEAGRTARQGLPLSICTHRYNYTGPVAEATAATEGLDALLQYIEAMGGRVRYLSSPELGAWLAGEPDAVTNPANGEVWPALRPLKGLGKLQAFLLRLWHRHAKLRRLAVMTGLVIPAGLLVLVGAMDRYLRA